MRTTINQVEQLKEQLEKGFNFMIYTMNANDFLEIICFTKSHSQAIDELQTLDRNVFFNIASVIGYLKALNKL